MPRLTYAAIMLLGCALVSAGGASPTPTSAPNATPSPTNKLPYTGINMASAEFGSSNIPGVLGTDYIWPGSSMTYFANSGMNIFRVGFLWERAQKPLNTSLIDSYLSGLDATIDTIASLGAIAIIQPHNFGRYPSLSNEIIGQSSTVDNGAFNDFWTRMANRYKNRANVWINIVNEPHDMDTKKWVETAQSVVYAIRAAGFTNKIIVPGNYWTGGWAWYETGKTGSVTNAEAFIGFKDPLNNFFIEAHQYLDKDCSGTFSECVSETIGVERLTKITKWARDNKFKTFLGEIGGSNNSVCIAAIDNTLAFLEANSDVWQGFTYWAAGPWWPLADVNEIEPRSMCGREPCKSGVWNAVKKHLVNPPKATTVNGQNVIHSPSSHYW
ncbi:glycoside hydrolase superfamily [Cladochytrium replicatum]|nr:glycoside hydrolase superfamily [Cladochytrium replicatum]